MRILSTLALALTLWAAPSHAAAPDTSATPEWGPPLGPGAARDTLAPQWEPPIGPGAMRDTTPPPAPGESRWSAPIGPGAQASAADTRVSWLWVTRGALTTPRGVEDVVARATAMGVRGVLVQVIGRGDAWYASQRLPRAEALANRDFDPLGELLPAAHAAGLEVHAWVNAVLVWSAEALPRDPRHVVRAHPEWVAKLEDGRRLTQLTPEQRRELGIEGVYLNPAHPGVRAWLAAAVTELASRYPVDGIHLDHIRQPGARVGYDPDTRARFALEHGADPARFDRMPAARRREMETAWSAFQRRQVDALVDAVGAAARAARPDIQLSAAVLADTVSAAARAQEWKGWLRDGRVSRVFVMCYATPVPAVLGALAGYARDLDPARVVPGIAVYNTDARTAAAKIRGAFALGYPEIALYSYDALFERPDGWDRLRAALDDAPLTGTED